MEPFTKHRGIVALLDRGNIDTDQIIPKQFLKSIKKTGYGEQLFYDWRYLENASPNPEFELNQERFRGASVLVAGNNFGCGSSREHAVWAVCQYGFRVVIAPRIDADGKSIPAFADIFRNNSIKNGLLPIELSVEQVAVIKEALQYEERLEVTIDLSSQTITLHEPGREVDGEERSFRFEIDKASKTRLTQGLDDIELTLAHEAEIASFEVQHNPQLYR